MRQLVLNHAAGEAVKLLHHLLKIFIVVLDLDLCRTSHFRIYARYAEAAFVINLGSAHATVRTMLLHC